MKSLALLNFFIGFVAGLCTALFPKLTAIEVVNALYVLASQAFASFIGTVMIIFEWGKQRPPVDVFMAALAEAQSKVGALRRQVPDTSVVRAEDGSYLVIAKPAQAPRSCAVPDAISLKKRLCGWATFEFLVAQ